ncbi:AAA family ATPase [Tritonibacter mobilis]|uniref:AAA family ATPase n=1 Tax=Tritonibacter mobilis TaxID=379347 RepID=UPI001CDA52B3|nr:AAA family ATPase [Tritonibacter mobilis]MCA2008527.1 ATP-dependent RecD-like DNA helicase [Tritonibacter mobilis]
MTKICVIQKVLWTGHGGGAVMNVLADGEIYRAVAGASVLPRAPVTGECWELSGVIKIHPKHGQQVQVKRAVLTKPAGKMVLSFLRGANCPGIGRAKAKALWAALGEEIYVALEDPADTRIGELIGEDLACTARDAWKNQGSEVTAWRWCDSLGLPTSLSNRLSAIYGSELPERMLENPYRILAFTSWNTAERLAHAIKIPPHDKRRLVGAVEAVIFEQLDHGHTAIEYRELLKCLSVRLECSTHTAEKAVASAKTEGAVVALNNLIAGVGTSAMEQFILNDLAHRFDSCASQPDFLSGADQRKLGNLLSEFEAKQQLCLNVEQRNAVIMAAQEPVSVMSGGAGTGKTTALKAIHALADAFGVPVLQAALAGRAARRMTEATGKPARTIMSLERALKYGLQAGGSLLLIDESSMLDLATMYRLLRLLPETTRILFVGDPGQLPPVDFGLILHVLNDIPGIPKIHLHQVHRQAASTGIPAASTAVRNGQLPEFQEYSPKGPGAHFLPCPLNEMAGKLLDLQSEMPSAQIISAVRDGPCGANTINAVFHDERTQGMPELFGFCEGEPVIWTINNYSLDLMNGTLGTVLALSEDRLLIDFEGEEKWIEQTDAKALDLAYAITVHKAQGSQFSTVIFPHARSRITSRQLVYTAITRATSKVVILGEKAQLRASLTQASDASHRTTLIPDLVRTRSGGPRKKHPGTRHRSPENISTR